MMKVRWWIHIIVWASLYLFWVTILQNHAITLSRTLTVEFCYLLFIAANYYFHIYYTIPHFLYRKKYLAFAGSFIGAIVLASVLRTLLAIYMTKHIFLPGGDQPAFATVLSRSLLNISVWVVCIIAVQLVIEKIRFRKYIDALEIEKTKNEMDFLKAQFNPHFLFNSINSIYGHIDKSNPTARNMLLTFSEMLRYQLYECNVDAINIDKEINYIRNYTALQQIRKEEDLVVRLAIGQEVRGFAIAPLLFIAFIENAFKYASNNESQENKVEISLDKQDGVLFFKTFNTKDKNPGSPLERGGIGIANVKRRLEILYPDKHDLSIQDTDHAYEVSLKIQLP
ncbi:MAG TPA: histidine kinase [Puia sp.]|nr:histidine kinase [Puia sp.]